MSHDKTIKTLLILVLILLVMGVGGIFYLIFQGRAPLPLPNPSAQQGMPTNPGATPGAQQPQAATQSMNDAKGVTSVLADKIAAQASTFGATNTTVKSDPGSQWWTDKDGRNIIVDNTSMLEIATQVKYDDKLNPADTVWSKSIHTFIASQLTANGFAKDISNSSSTIPEAGMDPYVQAYTKSGTRCSVETSQQVNGDMNTTVALDMQFTCSDDTAYQDAYTKEVPYLTALKEKSGAVHIVHESADFAYLTVSFRIEGYQAILAKQGTTWKVVYKGQDDPDCSSLIANKVPTSIYDQQCLDKNTQQVDYKGY